MPRDVPLCDVWQYGFMELGPGQVSTQNVVPTLADPLHIYAKWLTVRLTTRHLSGPLHATPKVSMPRS